MPQTLVLKTNQKLTHQTPFVAQRDFQILLDSKSRLYLSWRSKR